MPTIQPSAARRLLAVLLLALPAALIAQPATAATVWDETTAQGDLSDDGLAPTSLAFAAGSNEVRGSIGNSGEGVDRDYFTFVIPEGMRLSSLTLQPDTHFSGDRSFLAMQVGPQVTTQTSGVGIENLLGWMHYTDQMVGANLLLELGIMTGQDFGNGLGSGTYSVWVQETGSVSDYGLDFQVAPVPLPGAALLMMSGVGGLAALRRRRATRTA